MSENSFDKLVEALTAIEPNLSVLIARDVASARSTTEKLLEHPNERVRANAYALLSNSDAGAFVAALPKAVLDPSRVVRMQIALCLRNVRPETLQPALTQILALLRDGDAGVRKFAIKGSAEITDALVITEIERLSREDREPHVRELAVGIIANR